jgi:hypothetical protein
MSNTHWSKISFINVVALQCGVSPDPVYVTENEFISLKCNIRTVDYTTVIWYFGPHANNVIIVAHSVGNDPVYSPDPSKPQYSPTDYVYNRNDGSLTVHGSISMDAMNVKL